VSAVELSHHIEGPEDAPVLVLSNSLGADRRMWDDQMPTLRERFRVVRYDTRGHGESPVPAGPYTLDEIGGDVLALLDGLGIERFRFCGLSLGGMTGMWVASEVPERVEQLVLCCTTPYFPPREMWDQRAATVRREGVAALADATIERWLPPDVREARPEAESALRDQLCSTPGEGYAGGCEAVRDMDLRPRLAAIRAPTLVIMGADDPSVSPEQGELLAAAIAGARLTVLEGARHIANVSRPEEFTRAVLDHLAG
jgi:3-oxoadipate enol-lactonase